MIRTTQTVTSPLVSKETCFGQRLGKRADRQRAQVGLGRPEGADKGE